MELPTLKALAADWPILACEVVGVGRNNAHSSIQL